MDESMSGSAKSGVNPSSPDTGNTTTSASEKSGAKLSNRGNGVEMVEDVEEKELIAKQTAISNAKVTEMDAFIDNHGDVGKAGSYRIDGATAER